MRRRSICAALVLGIAVLSAGVRPAIAQELDPAFRADILKLLEVTGAAKMGEQMASLMSSQVLEAFRQSAPSVPSRAFDIGKEVLDAEFAKAFSGPDSLLNLLVPIYARHLTQQEVKGLIAFYETELGRKTIAVMPAVMQESVQAGQEWGVKTAPRLQQVLMDRLKAEGFIK